LLNAAVVDATTPGQPFCASCWSQTVRVPVADVSGAALPGAGAALDPFGVAALAVPGVDELPADDVLLELLLQPATATSAATAAKLRVFAFTRVLLGCLSAALDIRLARQNGLDQCGGWHRFLAVVNSVRLIIGGLFPNRNRAKKILAHKVKPGNT